MGSKTEARRLARAAGVPVVPGTEEPVPDVAAAWAVARDFGYPILLKAALGGGGKGMRRVDDDSELESAFRAAAGEAERSFRSPELYIEKLIDRPRHVEIQVFGDCRGNLVHLGERECSIQRRHQKVIEECPSPLVAAYPEMRDAMGAAALQVARAAGYTNAGTVEFLVDGSRAFYFLEMNTRLQVEHPITELVTGLDLVHLQLRVAAGEPLPLSQDEIAWRGHAVECRIYAEDPYHQFYPSPGRVTRLDRPFGPGVRLDSGVYLGWTVPIDYDPLLAKLAVWGGSRDEAVARMVRALGEYSVDGIKTTIGFYRSIFADPMYRRAELHTGFIDEFMMRQSAPELSFDHELETVAAAVAAIHSQNHAAGNAPVRNASRWLAEGREKMLR
jgi:acetyl-CoA carboxylase biotin carboxylase subunit